MAKWLIGWSFRDNLQKNDSETWCDKRVITAKDHKAAAQLYASTTTVLRDNPLTIMCSKEVQV